MTRVTRKTVTVLFCDWVGSTALGEVLDAESVRGVQDAFAAEATSAVERHGGAVEKFIGDAMMAVFGVPLAHEDDALRAVRAAVELRDAVAALNVRLERQYGVRLAVRTGVSSGEAVAGDPTTGQALITGDVVNSAQWLEEAAGAGEILIGEITYRLVRDAVVVESVEEPASARRLLGVLTEAPAFVRRLDAPLVDRERELGPLRASFERVRGAGPGHFVTVFGTAGVGKSRLVNELLVQAAEHATVLEGRCLPYGEGITFFPLRSVVRQAAAIDAETPPEAARSRIAELVADDPSAATVADHLAATVGFSDAPVSTEETFWAVRRLLESLARQRPLVLSFDDLQWAEETFLDLVEYLGEQTREVPFLLVCMARPELLDERPTWGGEDPSTAWLRLEPLSPADSEELIDNLLAEGEVAEDAKRALAEAAEGNPLYLEEILGMLVDDGTLRQEDGRWRIGDLLSVRVPPTIEALIAARLDRLPPEERSVVDTAAVMGKWFRGRGLAELTGDPALPARLDALTRKEIIRLEPRSSGEPAYEFRHILIQDVAYRSLPKGRRADVHERFALWVTETYGARVREVEEIVGYHLEQAYRTRAELGRDDLRLAVRAASVLASAGRRALNRGDAPAATNLLQRSVALPGADAHARLGRMLDLARALRERGDLGGAENVLEEAKAAAAELEDRRLEARMSVERCYLRFFTDPRAWTEEALRTADGAIETLEEFGDDVGLADAWILIALYEYARCRIAEMERALDPALRHARRAGDPRQISTLRNAMTRAALVGPTPVERAIARCVEIASEQPQDRSLEAVTLGVRALLEAMRGQFEEARLLYGRSHSILDELGQYRLLAAMRTYAGTAELLAADWLAAERELRASADALGEIGDQANLSTTTAYLADALERLGRDDEAFELTLVSEETASEQDAASQVLWRLARASLHAKRGQLAEAQALALDADRLAAETDALNLQGDAALRLGEVLLASALRDEAAAAMQRAVERYEAKGNLVSAAAARRALASSFPGARA